MNFPKVSIIIPIYKAEPWLCRALDSICAQTFNDWECILVDDGSPDRCGEICDEYAEKDSRFKVIHQLNSGVSCARQVGHDAAQGEYSIHLDPDDWVEPTMLEELYTKAKEEEADMVICDFYKHEGGTEYYVDQRPVSFAPIKIIEQMVTTSPLLQQLTGSCCNKLVRRTCYNSVDNPIDFEPKDLSYGEDVIFNCRLLLNTVNVVSYLNRAFYHYEVRSDSLCSTVEENIQYLIEMQEKVIKDKHITERLSLKPTHLQILFSKKEFAKMKSLYPETQAVIISKYPHSMLSLALKGYPRIAYMCNKLMFLRSTGDGITY